MDIAQWVTVGTGVPGVALFVASVPWRGSRDRTADWAVACFVLSLPLIVVCVLASLVASAQAGG